MLDNGQCNHTLSSFSGLGSILEKVPESEQLEHEFAAGNFNLPESSQRRGGEVAMFGAQLYLPIFHFVD